MQAHQEERQESRQRLCRKKEWEEHDETTMQGVRDRDAQTKQRTEAAHRLDTPAAHYATCVVRHLVKALHARRDVAPHQLKARVGHKLIRRQIRPPHVSRRQARSAQQQLPGHSRRHRAQGRVDNVGVCVGVGPADVDSVSHVVFCEHSHGDEDGGLCGTIHIVGGEGLGGLRGREGGRWRGGRGSTYGCEGEGSREGED